eukprot:m.353243 g.353243  ORF g.353243 m.353243 type:complete len:77 (+) comp16715_c0_seq1:1001-1231(+)
MVMVQQSIFHPVKAFRTTSNSINVQTANESANESTLRLSNRSIKSLEEQFRQAILDKYNQTYTQCSYLPLQPPIPT